MGTSFAGIASDPVSFGDGAQEVIKILLYSSHSLVVKGVKGILKDEPSMEVLGHVSNVPELMLKIHASAPSLVILNEDALGANNRSPAIESIRQVLSEFPNLKFLMIRNTADHEQEMAALKTGINGVLSGNFEDDLLAESIRCIARGGLWYSRKVMEKFIKEQLFLHRLNGNERKEFMLPTFTRRELEIIQMAGKGMKNREIGLNLFISEKTVKHHISRIFKKLQIKRRAELRKFL